MKSILLTAIGGDLAQSVAKIIREFDSSIRLIGSDISERHGGRLFVDKFYKVPPASNMEYRDSVNRIVEDEKVGIVFPLSEQELTFFADQGDEALPYEWIGPGDKTLKTGLDKWQTWRVLSDVGIDMPWTVICKVDDPVDLPCIVKERRSSGSKNVDIVRTTEEAAYFRGKYLDGIFQELLLPDDQEITCAVYRNREGETAVLHMRRKLDDGGVTAWAEVVENDDLDMLCTKVADTLELIGSANIQLRLTDGGPRIFEINPRLSSSVLMRHKLGFTDVVWTLMECFGEKVNYRKIKAGLKIVRTHDAEII
jgi:carbamoyl-phosphate synthase large subunit